MRTDEAVGDVGKCSSVECDVKSCGAGGLSSVGGLGSQDGLGSQGGSGSLDSLGGSDSVGGLGRLGGLTPDCVNGRAVKPCIAMQTDFGLGGGGAMYGVCKTVDMELQVYDISHVIPRFNVQKASESLVSVLPFWPKGTVFVSVVDPGVGTERRASVARTRNGYYIVTPDNGTLTDVNRKFGIEAIRVIDEKVNRLKGTEKTSIFHGRDLFAYCAARLASGIIDFEGVGAEYPVAEIVEF
ncbi:MAG: SAM-dependent chlorinase/fluorinase [Sphaerochaetaceae bacterium]